MVKVIVGVLIGIGVTVIGQPYISNPYAEFSGNKSSRNTTAHPSQLHNAASRWRAVDEDAFNQADLQCRLNAAKKYPYETVKLTEGNGVFGPKGTGRKNMKALYDRDVRHCRVSKEYLHLKRKLDHSKAIERAARKIKDSYLDAETKVVFNRS